MRTRELAILAAIAVGFTACKKDKEEDPVPPAAATATLQLAFTFMNGADTFHLGDLVTDGGGNLVRFDTVRFYLSEFHCHDDADVIIGEFHGVYMLVDAASPANEVTLGTLTAQHVHAAAFNVGLDSAANHADPSGAAAPLNDLTMHEDVTTGYHFAVLEGKVDSDGSGTIDASDDTFRYVLQTDDLLLENEVEVHHTLAAGEVYTVEAYVDLSVVVSGVDVSAQLTTNTLDDLPLATQVMDSLVSAMGPDPD